MPKQSNPVRSVPFAFRLWEGGADERYLRQFNTWVEHQMKTHPGVEGKTSKAVAIVVKALIADAMGWKDDSAAPVAVGLTDDIRAAIKDEVERVVRQMAASPENVARLERLSADGGEIDEDELQAFIADLNQ